MKSQSTIKKHVRDLRKLIDATADDTLEGVIRRRIAYTVETVLRYEIEKTVGWRKPVDEVEEETKILVNELSGLFNAPQP